MTTPSPNTTSTTPSDIQQSLLEFKRQWARDFQSIHKPAQTYLENVKTMLKAREFSFKSVCTRIDMKKHDDTSLVTKQLEFSYSTQKQIAAAYWIDSRTTASLTPTSLPSASYASAVDNTTPPKQQHQPTIRGCVLNVNVLPGKKLPKPLLSNIVDSLICVSSTERKRVLSDSDEVDKGSKGDIDNNGKYQHLIVLCPKLSSTCIQYAHEYCLAHPHCRIELFETSFFVNNLLSHIYYELQRPTLITPHEYAQLCKNTKDKITCITRNAPLVQYLGGEIGQYIRYDNLNQNEGPTITFREIIKDIVR
jgi:hypothetical protein